MVGDRPVQTYRSTDEITFKELLKQLPANWKKRRDLRELGIVEAGLQAKSQGLKRQAAKTIQKKWFHLQTIFDYAKHNYEGVVISFG
jgi:hypothetical protein